jgi:hypothetical protein
MKEDNSEDLETLVSDIIANTPVELLVTDEVPITDFSIKDLNPYTAKQAYEKIMEINQIEYS